MLFYLSTLGGSKVIDMENIGNFETGKCFDALVIDPYTADSPFDVFPHENLENIFEKFVFFSVMTETLNKYL